jgi:hypothetical protein
VRLNWRNIKQFLPAKMAATAAKTINSLAPLAVVGFILFAVVLPKEHGQIKLAFSPVTMQQTMLM